MSICVTGLPAVSTQQICANEVGTSDGFVYDFYTDNVGTACMKLGPEGAFSVEWTDCGNFLARKGFRYDAKQTHRELGNIIMVSLYFVIIVN